MYPLAQNRLLYVRSWQSTRKDIYTGIDCGTTRASMVVWNRILWFSLGADYSQIALSHIRCR